LISRIGDGIVGCSIGDRIPIGFMPGWVEGEFHKEATSLGGSD